MMRALLMVRHVKIVKLLIFRQAVMAIIEISFSRAELGN